MAATKTVARKKVTRKAPAKRTARKVTAREPKRIINRKGTASKRTAAKKQATAKKQTATDAKVQRGANEQKQAEQVKKLVDNGTPIREAAEKVGISVSMAKRLNNKASVGANERIVGSDAEVGKKIAALRDKEGVPWPIIRARTGMSPKQIRSLYEAATGKSWKESGTGQRGGGSKTAAKKATTKTTAKRAGRGGRAKSTAKPSGKTAARSKATGKTQAAPRGRRAKAKSSAQPAAQPAGRTKRERRAQQDVENKKVLEAIWNLDTDEAKIPALLEGKTITVEFNINGNHVKPREYTVVKVKDVGYSDRSGRAIHYLDENHQNRATSTREITAVR